MGRGLVALSETNIVARFWSVRRVLVSALLAAIVSCAAPGPGPASRAIDPAPAVNAPANQAGSDFASAPDTETRTGEPAAGMSFNLGEGESLIAHAAGPVQIFSGPEQPAPNRVLDEVTILGSPRVLLVLEGPTDGWVRLSLPVRPNGTSGWAQASEFRFEVVSQLVSVDLSDFRLEFRAGTDVVLDTLVATGSPENPTPTGRYFVTDVVELADHGGPWGPFAIGLSAHSDTITEFNGGDGIVGIHGTNRPSKIGQSVSLGCIRVPNEVITELAALIELGTPVEISA